MFCGQNGLHGLEMLINVKVQWTWCFPDQTVKVWRELNWLLTKHSVNEFDFLILSMNHIYSICAVTRQSVNEFDFVILSKGQTWCETYTESFGAPNLLSLPKKFVYGRKSAIIWKWTISHATHIHTHTPCILASSSHNSLFSCK